ncbi:hypothetical protein PENTCL1PPCAC_29589 [Pristionchus entomophagus]|uniref:G protein-coupled receptor n=1 Tax=Pristionchus entomophagus TaxID=358040 RepID=A0AAV5UK22_9BILA|nr:hypothetical protein PENTCL1PPCAC_29589 [Pristionchus entomophagus]
MCVAARRHPTHMRRSIYPPGHGFRNRARSLPLRWLPLLHTRPRRKGRASCQGLSLHCRSLLLHALSHDSRLEIRPIAAISVPCNLAALPRRYFDLPAGGSRARHALLASAHPLRVRLRALHFLLVCHPPRVVVGVRDGGRGLLRALLLPTAAQQQQPRRRRHPVQGRLEARRLTHRDR